MYYYYVLFIKFKSLLYVMRIIIIIIKITIYLCSLCHWMWHLELHNTFLERHLHRFKMYILLKNFVHQSKRIAILIDEYQFKFLELLLIVIDFLRIKWKLIPTKKLNDPFFYPGDKDLPTTTCNTTASNVRILILHLEF